MPMVEIRLPEGCGVADAPILLHWHIEAGAFVEPGDRLAEVEADQVVLDITAPCAGQVDALLAVEGEPLVPGCVIARVDHGRTPGETPPSLDAMPREQRVPMTRLRARIAERLLQSQASTATLTTFNEVDMQPLQALMDRLPASGRPGITSFLVKAAVRALGRYPVLNASLDGNDIVYHRHHDIGVAVATPRGLVVPVVRRAQDLSLRALDTCIADLAGRAMQGRIALHELTGGTFTVSDGGTFGALFATPIINPPQSAILGVHATVDRPVARRGQPVVRPMKFLALSYDHRLIDGREAALWLIEFKSLIERPMQLLDDEPWACLDETPAFAPQAVAHHAAHRASLAESLARVLNVPHTSLRADVPFSELGLDSQRAVAWIAALNRQHGTEVPVAMVYAHPTLEAFERYFGALCSDSAPAAIAAPHVAPPVATARDDERDAVAIVGMSGRYASASSLQAYWELLRDGGSGVRPVPRSRWDAAATYDPRPFAEGKSISRWLGWLDGVERFDPLFFGISPADAEVMDPQQRLFLEEAYRAIEDAGHAPSSLSGDRCGVYLGLCNNDYATMLRTGPSGIAHRLGNSCAIASARIAYHLNLKGPAITVDTACSSSLVAMHLARQALITHEIDTALAGGVTLYLAPELYICWSAAGMLAPDGRCKTFDDRADGFVGGEGVGVVMMKRLADARRDGDRILGIVRASGLNQDGRSNGITAPSMSRQAELIRSVYERHGIDSASISYVEAHGTGTRLGDPVELQALTEAFRRDTHERGGCIVGSAKANIGHTTAAAGVAAVHKVLLCLANRQLVPSAHFESPNRHFDFDASPFRVNTALQAWEPKAGVRRAAVSSFGVSGTNAHLVIDEGEPTPIALPEPHARTSPLPIRLSAQTPERLQAVAAQLARYLRACPDLALADIAYTLRHGRDVLAVRCDFVARDRADLLHVLDRVAAGVDMPSEDTTHLDVTGRRIALPTYPFAPERYWAEGIDGPIAHPDEPANVPMPEPLALDRLIDELANGALDLDAALARARQALDEHALNGAAG